MVDTQAAVDAVASLIGGHQFGFADEQQFQTGVEKLFADRGVTFAREHRLSASHRIDFMVADNDTNVGVELKVAGSTGSVTEQITSYLRYATVDGIVLVTTQAGHRAIPTVIDGHPVRVVYVSPLNGAMTGTPVRVDTSLGSLTRDGDLWVIKTQPHIVMRVKRMFQRIRQTQSNALLVTATDEVSRDLLWMLDRWPLTITPEDEAVLRAEADSHIKRGDMVLRVLGGEPLDGEWRVPARDAKWPHQTMNADLITTVNRLLITDQLGGGKTYSGLMTLRNPDALPAVVVCPTHLPRQWAKEIAATWPDMNVHITKTRAPYEPPADTDILIVPYSKLAGWAGAIAGTNRSVIFDEVHELRTGVTSQKGGAASVIARDTKYVVGLSATPVFNYGGDIHNVLSVVNPSVLGTRDEFLREWCGIADGGKPKVRDPEALATFLRAEGAMVGSTLPPTETIRIEHTVESDPDVFARLAADCTEMAKRLLDTDTAPTERWQVSGEFDMRMRQATGIAKAPYVASFVQMLLGSVEKVVLFGWHRAVYQTWMQQFAGHAVMYTGSETANQKQAALDAFIDGPAKVLIMSLRSGAGVDGLQAVSHTCVFGELDWSPAVHDQAIGRLDRPGQTEGPVLAYFLTSDEGADPVMADVLSVKTRQAAPFVNRDISTLGGDIDTGDRIRRMAANFLNIEDGLGSETASAGLS